MRCSTYIHLLRVMSVKLIPNIFLFFWENCLFILYVRPSLNDQFKQILKVFKLFFLEKYRSFFLLEIKIKVFFYEPLKLGNKSIYKFLNYAKINCL